MSWCTVIVPKCRRFWPALMCVSHVVSQICTYFQHLPTPDSVWWSLMVHVGKNAASAEFGPQKRCRSQARRQRPHPDSLKQSLPQENRGQFRFSMSFVIPIICRKHSKGLWLLENCHVFLCRGDGDVLELTVPCANLWCVHIRVLKSKMDYKHNSFGKLKLLQQEISINIRLRTKSKDMSKQFYQFITHHEVLLLRNAIVAICVSFSCQCRFG